MVICLRVKIGFSCRWLLAAGAGLCGTWLWAGSISIMGSGEEGDEPGDGGHIEEEPA